MRVKKTRVKKVLRKPRKIYRRKRSLKTTIKRTINSLAEKKYYQTSAVNIAASSDSTAGIIQIVFAPSQGTGQANRVGNLVKLLRVDIRGHVNMKQTTSSSIYMNLVKVFLCRLKQSILPATGTDLGRLMQSGNTSSSLGPDVASFYRPFNRDRWNVYKSKNMKIGYQQNGSGAGTPFNNDYSVMQPFYFTLKPNKVVRFDETSSPQNYDIQLGCVAIDTLGSATVYNDAVEYHYEAIFTYVDI